MKKIFVFLLYLLVVSFMFCGRMGVAVASFKEHENRFIYLGEADGSWYLDTQSITYNSDTGFIEYSLMSDTVSLWRGAIREWLTNSLNDLHMAMDMSNQVSVMFVTQVLNMEENVYYDKQTSLYDAKGIFLYRIVTNSHWKRINKGFVVSNAVEWIKDNIPIPARKYSIDEAIKRVQEEGAKKHNSSLNANPAETNSKVIETVALSLLCGILLCIFIVIAVQDFMTKKPPTAVQPYECPDDEVIDAIFVDEPRKEKD